MLEPQERHFYRWILDTPIAALPTPPFKIRNCTVNGTGWYEVLKREARHALDHLDGKQPHPHPRQIFGALLEDIRALEFLTKEKVDA